MAEGAEPGKTGPAIWALERDLQGSFGGDIDKDAGIEVDADIDS